MLKTETVAVREAGIVMLQDTQEREGALCSPDLSVLKAAPASRGSTPGSQWHETSALGRTAGPLASCLPGQQGHTRGRAPTPPRSTELHLLRKFPDRLKRRGKYLVKEAM